MSIKSLVVAALLLTGGAADAASFTALGSFGVTGTPFSFGSGFGGSFAALPDFAADNCVGTAGLACYNTNGGLYTFPAIAKNISASNPLVFYTNVLPLDTLFLQTLPGTPVTVRFTAPVTSTYTFAGSFSRIDSSDGSGDGVVVGVATGVTNDAAVLGTTFGETSAINRSVVLTAGTAVDFYVDARGNTNNDGTGLVLSASYVPEPAMWALMVGGFGVVGAVARRRRTALAA